MSAGTRRRKVSVQLGKRVGTQTTANPPVRGTKVLGQSLNRIGSNRRRKTKLLLGKRVGVNVTANAVVKGPRVLGQVFRRVKLRVKVFGAARFVKPTRSTLVNLQHAPYKIIVKESFAATRARIKRLTAKTKLGKTFGLPTKPVKVFAPVVMGQSRGVKFRTKRVATRSRLFRPYGGIIAPPPPVTVRKMPYIRVYQ